MPPFLTILLHHPCDDRDIWLESGTQKMRSSTQHAVYFLIIVVTSIIVSVFWIEFLSGFKKEIQAFKFINIIAKKNSTKPMNKAIESKTNSTYVILIYNGHLKLFMEHFRKKEMSTCKKLHSYWQCRGLQ